MVLGSSRSPCPPRLLVARAAPQGGAEDTGGIGSIGAGAGGEGVLMGARNVTVATTFAATAVSPFMAGEKRQARTAATAASANGVAPSRTVTSVTSPPPSTTTTMTTVASPDAPAG